MTFNLKFVSFTIILLTANHIFSQKKIIYGKTLPAKEKDTISLVNGVLSVKYYEAPVITSNIVNNKFKIAYFSSYPQMYFLSWKSEAKDILFYGEPIFIDNSTSEIVAKEKNCEVTGESSSEYIETFVPYILNKSSSTNIDNYIFENGNEFDSKLANYIKSKNDSYVALWYLIMRFNENGYSSFYEEMLNSFSKKIKSEKLWLILNAEFQAITIKENGKFPKLSLKTSELKDDILKIPDAKFTLIDFWFSRCRPCLEQMPSLIAIYNTYNVRGFNIIGVSTDKTINIDIWKKRIIEKEIPWKNYLDENAILASKEKILSFPTNFLLDKNGKIIKKNISPNDLEYFLKENLKL